MKALNEQVNCWYGLLQGMGLDDALHKVKTARSQAHPYVDCWKVGPCYLPAFCCLCALYCLCALWLLVCPVKALSAANTASALQIRSRQIHHMIVL